MEPGTISFDDHYRLEVIDVSRWNVWNVIKDVMTVEPRTEIILSTTDVSDRPYAVLHSNRGPF